MSAAKTTPKRPPARKAKPKRAEPRRRAARRPLPSVPGRHRATVKGMQRARLVGAFLAGFLKHPDREFAGRPFVLETWQLDNILLPLFACVDRGGRRKYREALIGLPRNSGKSNLSAALLLAIAFTEPIVEGEYVCVARNRKQAAIVFNKMRRMVYADPLLRAACDVRTHEIIIKETGQRIYTVAYDAGGAQGIHAQVAIIDEYHVHKDDSMRYAILSGMIGQPGALLITISTAGEERKGALWELLKSAPQDPRAYVYWVGAAEDADGHDPAVWRAANPQSWVSDRDLLDAYNSMPFPAFERYHLNRFPSKGTNRAYPAKLWHACAERPRIDTERPSVIGLDASWTRDTTAVVFDQVDAAGWHNWLAWVWRKDEALGYIDHDPIEAKIVELCEDFNVRRVACDPNYFTRSMLRLQNEYGLPVEEFRQNDFKMSAASMMLLDVLKEGRGRHGGDPELTDQMLNAGLKETPHGWRLTKVQDDLKIDAAVACVMASYLAESEALTAAEPRVVTASPRRRGDSRMRGRRRSGDAVANMVP
jgi:phage terminase large subunit-like protein